MKTMQQDIHGQGNIIILYGVFIFSLVTNFIPSIPFQILGFALLFAVMVMAYVYRMGAKRDSLVRNHMTYLIGTIWIGSILLLAGICGAAYWIYTAGNHSSIMAMAESLNETGKMPGTEDVMVLSKQYIRENISLLLLSGVLCIGPGIVYTAFRTWHGFSRALKGYRIARPESWF